MKTGSSSSPQPTTIGKGKKTEKLKRATVWEWRAKVEQLRRHTRHLRRPIGRRNHRFSRRIGFDPMAAVFTSADPRVSPHWLSNWTILFISSQTQYMFFIFIFMNLLFVFDFFGVVLRCGVMIFVCVNWLGYFTR